MIEVHYQGPAVKQYAPEKFFNLMENLGAKLVDSGTAQHPQNTRLPVLVVNVWELVCARILYTSAPSTGDSPVGTARVTLEGDERNKGEVERRIAEGVEQGLHDVDIPFK